MTTENCTVRIFMSPQQFPCGPQSTCCGPVGQSEEEIQNLKIAIETELDLNVEVLNSSDEQNMNNFSQIQKLIRSFGPKALPIISLDEEVISLGNPVPEQAVSAIRDKMA